MIRPSRLAGSRRQTFTVSRPPGVGVNRTPRKPNPSLRTSYPCPSTKNQVSTPISSGRSNAITPALSEMNRTLCVVRNSTSGTGQPPSSSTTSIRHGWRAWTAGASNNTAANKTA